MTIDVIIEIVVIALLAVGMFVVAHKKRNDLDQFTGGKQKQRLRFRMFSKEPIEIVDAPKPKATGSQNDYVQLLSRIVTLARKKKWQLIAPAVVGKDEGMMQFVALIITPAKLIAIRAYGFGGTIIATSGEKDWKQELAGDGTPHTVPSPIKGLRVAQEAVLQAMSDKQISLCEALPMEFVAVYTNPGVTLRCSSNSRCYKSAELLAYLQEEPAFEKEQEAQSKEQLAALKTIVENLKTPNRR